ncbi:MAG: chemotaxis protein CheW [Desulfobacterales bacterium]
MAGDHYLIFAIDEQHFAVPASTVERVIRAVQPAYPLDAPDLMLGLINMGEAVVPLINIRKQFGLPERPIRESDRIILSRACGFSLAFAVDKVAGVDLLYPEPAIDPETIYPAMRRYITGAATFDHQTVFIYDIDTLIPQTTLEQAKLAIDAV